MTSAGPAIPQGFLPAAGQSRAFVWKYSPFHGGRRPRHFHIEPEFNLIASGRATFGIGDGACTVSEGDILGLPAAQDHVLLDASADLYLFAVGMDPAFSSDVLRAGHGELMLPIRFRLGTDDFRSLVHRASAIVDRDGAEQPCAELWEQAHWLMEHQRSRPMNAMHVLTRRAVSAVSHAPDLELQSLAARLGTSDSEVSRYFHRDLGLTFAQYRTRLRILRMMRLMEGRGSTLKSAARMSGFGSYSQCHRIFQARLGCSPKQFFHGGLRQQMQRAYDP